MNKEKPNSRFGEFDDGWKSSALRELTKQVTRKNEDLESDLSLTISARYGLIAQTDFFNTRIASNTLKGYYLIEKGEFAYNKSYSSDYPVGAVKRLNRYDKGVLSTLYILFESKEIVLPEWFEAFFESNKWHREIVTRASEGARNHGLLNISPTDFFDIPIAYPTNKEEQREIAQFFTRIDTLISAEEQKVERLKNMKAASLEKMFPRKGKTIPEVRFGGFQGEWQCDVLSNAADYYHVSNENIHHQNLLSLSYGKIINKDIKSKKGLLPASFDTYQVIKQDIIVLRFTDLQNDHKSLRVGISKQEGIITSAYVCIKVKDGIFPDFLYLLLHFYDLCKVFYSMGDGMRQTLNYNDIKSLGIVFPSDINEQKMIVSYFSRLDTLIAAHEQKVARLRNMKKSFLDNMFVTA